MNTSFKLLQSSSLNPDSPDSLDPTEGSVQFGYREISGNIPSTREPVTLRAWAIVFKQQQSEAHYHRIVTLLGRVGKDGLVLTPLADISGDRLGNMSERTDLLGDVATIWVTAIVDGGSARGAVLVALNRVLIHVLALPPYTAEGRDRAVHLIESIALHMAARDAKLQLAPQNDTMSRLPLLYDVAGSIEDASIGINRYTSPP